MQRTWTPALLLCAALGACVSQDLAERDAGVGFGDYETYLAERQAAERRAAAGPAVFNAPYGGTRPGPEPTTEPVSEPFWEPTSESVTSADLAAAGIGSSAPAPSAAAISSEPPEVAPVLTPAGARAVTPAIAPSVQAGGGTALSDEQSFAAVASRESIESDAARLQAQRALRAEAAPRPLGERPDEIGADIVAFALATRHPVGQQRYNRFLASEGRAARLCRRYPGADMAQRAFLEAGGPERDRLGLDPDGDGYACTWSPEPFRTARG